MGDVVFDFFKDVYLEAQGIDSDEARKVREERKEIKKLGRYIFSKKMKISISFLAIIYLILVFITFKLGVNSLSVMNVIKYIILSLISLSVVVLFLFKSKKTEIIALVLIIVFITGNYLSLFIK